MRSDPEKILDNINNVESIYFPGLATGASPEILEINVVGVNIPIGGSQPYSLVLSGAVAQGPCTPNIVGSQPQAVITKNSVIQVPLPTNSCPPYVSTSTSQLLLLGEIVGIVIAAIIVIAVIAAIVIVINRKTRTSIKKKTLTTPIATEMQQDAASYVSL